MVSSPSRTPGTFRFRTAAVAGVTALGLAAVAAFAPPALADPLDTPHDFESDAQGWFAYGAGVTSEVVDGEFCVTVPTGVANPWDAAAQHNDIVLDENVLYTVTFDAHATADVTVPLQIGVGWPNVFGASVALTDTPDTYTYTFTPADWDTPQSTTAAQMGFQLGAQVVDYTMCIDNVQITGLTEWVPGGDFERSEIEPWFVTPNLADAWTLADGQLCVDIPGGTSNPWDAIVGVNGIPISPNTAYTFSLEASATPGPKAVRALVQLNADPWPTVFDNTVQAPETTATFSWSALNESHEWPATPENEAGQVAFQVGGSADPWTLCLDNVSLLGGGVAEPYSPETGPTVRVNQAGYLPDGPKRATLVTDETDPVAWELRDVNDGDTVVASGVSAPEGIDWSSNLNVHVIDFSAMTTEGTYALAADGEVSYEFAVDAALYQQLRYDALNYFYLARSGIEIDAAIVGSDYARVAGHLNNPSQTLNASANKGDYEVPCLTQAEDGGSWSYGDWTCPDGYTLDVVGGWYDAGDHGKYVVNGGISVAQVMSTYERSLYAPTGTPTALADGTLDLPESTNGVPDVLDEAAWELEWMLSMQIPGEYAEYAGMVHHKIHDVGWTGIPLLPVNDAQERRLHRPSTAATLNLAAAAAQGARLFADHESEYPGFADELLDAARVAWDAALATPDLYAPAAAGANGGGPYDDTDVSDEFYWAAAELYITTGEPEFLDAVLENPNHTADVFGAKAFDWRDVAAFARTQLALVPNGLPGRAAVQDSVVAGADAYVAWQADESFATTYPGEDAELEDYEWGSNSMVVNNANVLAVAFDLTSDDVYREAALEAMDYILGRNALNISYVTGYGTVYSENQHSRWFANQANPDLPHPPVGSLAGGPNSTQSTWDPTMQGLFGGDNVCAPSMCYIDYYNSWASNEITVNWNSALSYLASFVADQGAGAVDAGEMVTITEHPVDQAVGPGVSVTFTAAATGNPVPTVQWQALPEGADDWIDVPDADSTTLTLPVTPWMDGRQFRAVFTNEHGWIATDPAVLTVTSLFSITPVRVLTAPSVAPGGVQCFQVAGVSGVPSDATGVVVNVTTVRPNGVGYVVVYPDTAGTGSTPRPGTSTVNFEPGSDVANLTFVSLPANGKLCYSTAGAGSVGILMDVSGYTTDGTGIHIAPPVRLLDTRASSKVGSITGPVGSRMVKTVQVGGVAGVPEGAEAVLLNVTVTGVSSIGNLRVYPGDEAVPNASVINYAPGVDKANAAVVALSEDGEISFYSDTALGVQVIIDVLGYVEADADYDGLVPTRVVDTRSGGAHTGPIPGALVPRTVYSVDMRTGAVPEGATAVVLNVTAIGPTMLGNLRVYPDSDGTGLTAPPNASALNYIIGRDIPNLVVVHLPANGQVNFYSDQPLGGRVHLAVDVVGYLGVLPPV